MKRKASYPKVERRKENDKRRVLEELRKYPIIEVACKRAAIPRTNLYRWRSEDAVFDSAVEEALREGRLLVNDIAESQILSMIKNQKFPAVSMWLKHHHPLYSPKDKRAPPSRSKAELTEEQKEQVKRALGLFALKKNNRGRGGQNN